MHLFNVRLSSVRHFMPDFTVLHIRDAELIRASIALLIINSMAVGQGVAFAHIATIVMQEVKKKSLPMKKY